MPAKVYDCIVVGGGAVGWAVAYELSAHGVRTAVLDHAAVPHQASWAAAGIIPPADQTQAHNQWQQMVALGHRLHADWADRLRQQTDIDVEYRRCGAIHFARTAGEAAALRAACQQWQDDGIDCHALDAQALRTTEPSFSPEITDSASFFAVWMPDEAQVRPPRFLLALRTACVAAGVDFFGDVVAGKFHTAADRAISIITSNGTMHAETFCVAAGAWTAQLIEPLGVTLAMRPYRGQMVLLTQVEPKLHVILNEGPNYLVPRADGRILVGSTVEDVGFQVETTSDAITRLESLATELRPEMTYQLESTWSALRPGTGDGFPFIGRLPNFENVFVAAGHFRSGIALAPATATLVRQCLLGQRPSIPISPFRPERE